MAAVEEVAEDTLDCPVEVGKVGSVFEVVGQVAWEEGAEAAGEVLVAEAGP